MDTLTAECVHTQIHLWKEGSARRSNIYSNGPVEVKTTKGHCATLIMDEKHCLFLVIGHKTYCLRDQLPNCILQIAWAKWGQLWRYVILH